MPEWETAENIDGETGEVVVVKGRTGKRKKIEVHLYEAEKGTDALQAGYVFLMRCASPLICPVCSSVIRAKRGEEITKAGRIMLQHGYNFIFATFTAAHSRNEMPLCDYVDHFNMAYRLLQSGKAWEKFKAKWCMKYTIKTVETTDDAEWANYKTGWHYHAHTIFFIERLPLTQDEKTEFQDKLRDLWLIALKKAYLTADKQHGCFVELPGTIFNGELVEEYSIKKLAEYISKAVGFEMTGYKTKEGRRKRRISVWKLQEMALTSKPELIPRYTEYVMAMRGINFMRWSPGLKAFCGINDISDAEIMRGEKDEWLYNIEQEKFQHVANQGGQRKLLVRAVEDGRFGVKFGLATAENGCDIETGEELSPDLWAEKTEGV